MGESKSNCEYCQVPQAFYPSPFQNDHIIARKHGGSDEAENVATACFHCNNHKGPNIAGIDPLTKRLTRLFHPRHDKWDDHFRWAGLQVLGITDVGRVTVAVLEMNDKSMIAMRMTLMAEGVFPPR
jgi:hypothetical protein